MKNENVLKKFFSYEFTDLKALEEYFTEMSAEGWFIRSIRSGIFEFTKGAPAKLRYSVEIIPTASRNTNQINPKTAEYIDLCVQSGWIFVCNSAEVFVFVTYDENAPEITTDSVEKIKSIKKSVLARNGILWLVALINIFNISLHIFSQKPEKLLPFWVVAAIFWISYVIMIVIKSLSFNIWYKNAEVAINEGKKVKYNGREVLGKRKKYLYAYLIFIGLLLVAMAVWLMVAGENGFAIALIVEIVVITAVILPLVIVLNKSNLSMAAMVLITLAVVIVLISIMAFPIILLI